MSAKSGDRASNWLLTACAVVLTSAFAWRQVSPPVRTTGSGGRSTFVDGWQNLHAGHHRSGPDSAAIQVLEFVDLECPFCRGFAETWRGLEAKYRGRIALTFVHYPIASHRFAVPAARAAECAADQGLFAEYVDAVFHKQDSLGLKSWASFADDIGLRDTVAFRRCTQRTEPVRGIDRGRALADSLGVRVTPTLIVNGWRLQGNPTAEALNALVEDLLQGRRPRMVDAEDED